MPLDRRWLARKIADVGARTAGGVERQILALMHAGILFGLHPFGISLAVDDSWLHHAVGKNVIVEVGELRRRVSVDLTSQRDWKSLGGPAGQVFSAEVDGNLGHSYERLRGNLDRSLHQGNPKFLDAKIPGCQFLD